MVKEFRVKRTAKMLKLMECYSKMRGVEWNTFVFLLDGSRVREFHTPDEVYINSSLEILIHIS